MGKIQNLPYAKSDGFSTCRNIFLKCLFFKDFSNGNVNISVLVLSDVSSNKTILSTSLKKITVLGLHCDILWLYSRLQVAITMAL